MRLSSLRHRFTLVMLTASASFGLAVLVVGYLELSHALRESTRAASQAQLAALAPMFTERILVEDGIGLRRSVNETAQTTPRWTGLLVTDSHGQPLASSPPDLRPPAPSSSSTSPTSLWIQTALGDPAVGWAYARVSISEDEERARIGARRLAFALAALTVTGVSVAALMGWWLTGPLDAMRAEVERVGLGDFDVRVPTPATNDEIALLAQAINRSIEAIAALRRREAESLRGMAEVEKLAALGRLAAGVAHEVANPLAGVAGCLRRLAEPDLPADRRRRYAEAALEGVERSHRVLRDLLGFARPPTSAPEPADVMQLVERVVAMATPRAGEGVEILPTPAVQVLWPRQRVEQILLNLVLNAQRASRGRVKVGWRLSPLGCRIEVLDDGPGVDPRIAPRLFEPFVTTSEPGQGTGLGLAVARAMARGMSGDVGLDRVQHADEEWTVAWLELPLAVTGEEDHAA